jgi:WD40 repeat protein
MIGAYVFLYATGLILPVYSTVLPGVKTVLVNNVLVPKTKTNFAKDNVTARWAPGYPKEWGSEDYYYQINDPEPDDNFHFAFAEDGKVLALTNSTHAKIFDLSKNTSVSTFPLDGPTKNFVTDLKIWPAAQGGYELFAGYAAYQYDIPKVTHRQSIDSDLIPVGTPIEYQGPIGAISKEGKMASLTGYIYDLTTTDNTPIATIEGQPDLTDFSFNPDGVRLASVSWHAMTADLWNATSGQKVFEFPSTQSQNWAARFSPDGKYILFVLGSPKNTIQIYQSANLSAAPIEIKGFNDWPRNFAWSPTGEQLAVGDPNRLRIFNIPSQKIIQTWEVDVLGYPIPPTGKFDHSKSFELMFERLTPNRYFMG